MKIYNNTKLNLKHKKAVVAIGNFDGVHMGHQKVLKEAKIMAKKLRLPFGVMTFEPMPVMFFNKKIENHRINSCLLYTSPSPRDRQKSRMPSSA